MTVAEDLAAYRAVLVQMHAHRVDSGGKRRTWNRLFDQVQVLQLRLRQAPEGQAGITAFALSDDCPTVVLSAASHALFWDEARVRTVLEALALGDLLLGLDAKMTLREFDAGRLNMTWQPKGG